MSLQKTPFKCEYCGAPLTYDDESKLFGCAYCGMQPNLTEEQKRYIQREADRKQKNAFDLLNETREKYERAKQERKRAIEETKERIELRKQQEKEKSIETEARHNFIIPHYFVQLFAIVACSLSSSFIVALLGFVASVSSVRYVVKNVMNKKHGPIENTFFAVTCGFCTILTYSCFFPQGEADVHMVNGLRSLSVLIADLLIIMFSKCKKHD